MTEIFVVTTYGDGEFIAAFDYRPEAERYIKQNPDYKNLCISPSYVYGSVEEMVHGELEDA